MRRLLLLRHAKTETDAPSGKDFDRRLDDRGLVDAAAMGAWLNRHPPLPDLVCVSTAARARQTWELVAAELPRGRAEVKAVFGGLNVVDAANGTTHVIATAAVEAFLPIDPTAWELSSTA